MHRTTPHAAATLLAAALLATEGAAQLAWQPVSSAQSPSPRYGHSVTRWGLTFGGRDAMQAFDDLWVSSSAGWQPLVTATAPSPRHGHAMDMALDDVLLFGGADANGVRNGETWNLFTTWHTTPPGLTPTNVWTLLQPAHSPSARDGHALVYDQATSSEALLFGGRTDTGLSDETWLYTNGDWQQLTPGTSPAPREGHTMRSIWDGWLVVGGNDDNQVFDDVWWFDGQTWTLLGDAPFAATGAASDLLGFERQRHVFVGGRDAAGALRTEVFERDRDGQWYPQPISGAMPPREHASVHDHYLQTPSLDSVMTAVVFGGRDAQGQALGDTWRLMPTNVARETDVGAGCGPGSWSNNGPEVWARRVILGNSTEISVFTATSGALAVLGVQLGAAAPPQPCEITVQPELTWFGLSQPTLGGRFVQSIDIPFVELLRGQDLSFQALVFEPSAANGLAISRVVILSLGD